MFRQLSINLVSASLLACLAVPATADLGDQWYVGAGYSNALLYPRAADNAITRQEEVGTGATVFFGRDFDERSSGQFQLYTLGDTIFSDETIATFSAADASILYRFFDSRDGRRNAVFGTSVYGRFGMGYLERETDVELSTESSAGVYFGVGAGLETYFTDMLALRGEMMYHDADAISGNISVVARFGGRQNRAPRSVPQPVERPPLPTPAPVELPRDSVTSTPVPSPQAMPIPPQATLPETYTPPLNTDRTRGGGLPTDNQVPEVAVMVPAEEFRDSSSTPTRQIPAQPTAQPPALPTVAVKADSDGDGVFDDVDRCSGTLANSLVDGSGCSPFARIAQNLQFVENSPLPLATAEPALNELAALLRRNVNTRVELAAHSDNAGDPQQKSLLTRQRLRAIGIYLVQRGISQDRLLLRSFGSKRPVFDNNSEAGRRANNRIEITEQP